MSRCFPFPPPGYEKKFHLVDLGLPAKEHKHKDKKTKRKKNCETNGAVHDKDKQCTKIHGTELVNDVIHSKKQRQPKAWIATVVEHPLERSHGDAAERTGNQKHLDIAVCHPELYSKDQEANGKAASKPSILSGSLETNSNKGVGQMFISCRQHLECDHVVTRQKHSDILPQAESSNSAVDDQEWLFVHNDHSHPKVEIQTKDSGGPSQVWTEVLYLPSVDIYALPYVVPY
eukprot:c21014_g3_i2 orf=245-937(-)